MQLFERWRHTILEANDSQQGRLGQLGIFWARLILAIIAQFRDEQLQTRSTSLSYTTLLSLVPFLAVTFSVLKGFGVQNQLKPMLMSTLEPLGAKGAEIGQSILSYVDNLNFAVLGFMGIAMLFWTVISLLTRVEETFNAIWHVPSGRSMVRRFSDYLSVALVGPVFVVTALGITTVVLGDASVQRIVTIEPIGRLLLGLGRLVPYLLICVAFAFLYAFLTNYRVRMVPALVGGIFASLAWYGIGHLFAHLVAGSSKYSAIYSSLAAAVLFIIWVNVGWMIVLVGAHIARYWQFPHLLGHELNGNKQKPARNEILALDLMTLIGRAHYFDEPRWTLENLTARGCCGSPKQVEQLLQTLREGNLVVATNDQPETYLPARAIEHITLEDILRVAGSQSGRSAQLPSVREMISQIDEVVVARLSGKTLMDLVASDDKPST